MEKEEHSHHAKRATQRASKPVGEKQSRVPTPSDDYKRLASSIGNRSFTRLIGRIRGDGILPNGSAHPALQRLIQQRSGKGRKLSQTERKQFDGELNDSFHDVSVHADAAADRLSRAVNAEAFAVRSSPVARDLFFARGTYKPGTRSGDEVFAEEMAHLHQQKQARMTSELKISDPRSALEKQAAEFARGLSSRNVGR